ncbi:hypothetical protein DFH28DRAFT_900777 [Melampsora americana]|nr:hypothetical protein DFH28DRAFT_900777 [Melampsora americana]
MEEQYHSSQIIPALDHVAHTQLEYLKSIEAELMDDIYDVDLHEVQHPLKLNPASLWSNPPSDIDTFLQSKGSETSFDSPTSKRRKMFNSISTHFQVPDANPRPNYESMIHAIQGRDNSLVPQKSTSVIDPWMASPDILQHDDNPNLVRLKYHISSPIVYKNLGLQHSSSLKQTGYSPQEPLQYSACQAKNIINTLKWKGGLVMWHNPELSTQIQYFFDTIDRKSHLNLESGKIGSHLSEINSAIERLRCDVVIGYFGGLLINFWGYPNIPSMHELMADGWEFLQKYLYGEFYPGQNRFKGNPLVSIEFRRLPKPFRILNYTLSLKKSQAVSPLLIETLISHWKKQTKLNLYGIKMDTHHFLAKIQSTARLLGKNILRKATDTWKEEYLSQSSNFQRSKSEESTSLTKWPPLSRIRQNPASFLEKIGKMESHDQTDILDEIHTFFIDLETDIIKQLHKAITLNDLLADQDCSPYSFIINHLSIQVVIQKVRDSLVPQVLGTLILSQDCPGRHHIKADLLNTGWEVLKAYFSPWKTLFVKDPSAIFVTETNDFFLHPKWYDPKYMMHYYCLRQLETHHAIEPIWFIIQIWYDMLINKRIKLTSDFQVENLPPNRIMYHKILAYIENN